MSIGGKGVDFFATIVVFTILCKLALVLRWRAARLQGRRFQLDDGLLIFAWIAILAFEGTAIWTIFNGMGQHSTMLSAADWKVLYKDFVAAMVCWTVATVLVKLSILFLYIRIFSTSSFRRWARALILLVLCFGVTYFGIAMSTSIPLSEFWHPVAGGHCRDTSNQEIGSMVPNIFLDICIIALPMPWLWTLQMPLRNKIWVTLMFSLGGINLGIMCYRLYAAIHPSGDVSIDNATQGIFAFLELWIGVIVACMPTMAPIFVNYVLPLASSIHSKLFGSGPGADNSLNMGVMRVAIDDPAVNTFHRSNRDAHRKRNQHSLLGESDLAVSTCGQHEPCDDLGELHVQLVSPPVKAQVQTDCATAQDKKPRSGNGIYVQQDFCTHSDDE